MIGTTIQAQLPSYSWVKPITSSASSASSPSGHVSTDSYGNVYIAGSFQNTITIGSIVLTSAGSNDIYLAKYDSKGNVLWAKRAGGSDEDECYSFVVDAQGNSYLTGLYKTTAYFDKISVVSAGYDDFYIAKYDSNGNAVWVNSGNGPLDCYGSGISVDLVGNVYVTGSLWGDNNFSGIHITNNQWWNTFFVKYRSNGSICFAKAISSTGSSGANSITFDNAGHFYLGGSFSGTSTFGSTTLTSIGTISWSTAGRNADCFLSKLDTSGNFIWTKDLGANYSSGGGNGILIDKSGYLYFSGIFKSSISLGTNTFTSAGSDDIFIVKMDANGNFIWSKKYGGSNEDGNVSIVMDSKNNIYALSSYVGSMSCGSFNLNAIGGNSIQGICLAKLDTAGNFLNAKNIGTSASNANPFNLAIDNSGNLFTATSLLGASNYDTCSLTNTSSTAEIVIGKLVLSTIKLSSFIPTSAIKGDTITIKGMGFIGATSVTFGGMLASSFKVVNDSTITALVGNGKSGNVMVVSPNGAVSLGGFVFKSTGIPTNGLVAWYPFTGNAIDSSGSGNNGTVNGAALTTDRFGRANSAYSFNGNSNNIVVPYPILSQFPCDSNWCVSFWFEMSKPLDSMNSFYIFNNGSGISGQINPLGAFAHSSGKRDNIGAYWWAKAGVSTLDSIFTKNNWYNFTYLYNNSRNVLKVFVNGKDKSGDTLDVTHYGGTAVNLGKWYIGSSGWTTELFNGKIDDIRVYNRSLDSTEIQAIYHEGGYGNTLPINITNISAINNSNKVVVNWATVNELNTREFVVHHSTNGNTFNNLATLKAIGVGANDYEFTDNKPSNGINYYRLQSVDKDGSSSYSKVVSVNFGDNQSFSIIPNPAKDFATISFSKTIDKATIAVYDITGKQVITQSLNASANTYKLNTQFLKSGLYVIKVNTATGSYNEKLLINK